MMRIDNVLIDDLALQFNTGGISRLWRNMFQVLDDLDIAKEYGINLIVLNRSGSLTFKNITSFPFQSYNPMFPAADRRVLSAVAEDLHAKYFVSTHFTFSESTPNLSFLYDFIPEKFNFTNLNRGWLERMLSIASASAFLSISKSTMKDLAAFYPETESKPSSLAYPGIDTELFTRSDDNDILSFRKQMNLEKYFVFVGTKYGQGNYKNFSLVCDSLKNVKDKSLGFVIVGGEKINAKDQKILRKAGVQTRELQLSDSELVKCLSAAEGLIYPSLYEGFGLPVLEALAVGCPVITTKSSSLVEVVGNFGNFISGVDAGELAKLLDSGIHQKMRDRTRQHGPAYAKTFSIKNMAMTFCKVLRESIDTTDLKVFEKDIKDFKSYTDSVIFLQGRM
jgi:glycosyltransferase involved in cell wall biosynthesis